MYFESIYKHRKMKPVKIVLRRGSGRKRENDGGGQISLRYIVSTYVNITIYFLVQLVIC
jgi:hypothetical protein